MRVCGVLVDASREASPPTGQVRGKAVASVRMAHAALRSGPGGADHEARLARAAAAGNGRAFARLYERYEERVFNLALRITGSADMAARATREAFLDALRALPHTKGAEPVGSCLMRATRNAAHEQGEPGDRTSTVDEQQAGEVRDADPDLEEWQAQVRAASMELPVHERELLALEALDDLSYAAIGGIVDSDGDAVPERLAHSRLHLHDELFGTELAPAGAGPEDCDGALALMVMRDDGQLRDEEDLGWLIDHLAHCALCRRRLDAMEEASSAYREWEPAAAPAALAPETMAAAGQVAGADWTELAAGWAGAPPARDGGAGGADAAGPHRDRGGGDARARRGRPGRLARGRGAGVGRGRRGAGRAGAGRAARAEAEEQPDREAEEGPSQAAEGGGGQAQGRAQALGVRGGAAPAPGAESPPRPGQGRPASEVDAADPGDGPARAGAPGRDRAADPPAQADRLHRPGRQAGALPVALSTPGPSRRRSPAAWAQGRGPASAWGSAAVPAGTGAAR